VIVDLPFTPPLDWPALLGYFTARATPGVEVVEEERYLRTVALSGHVGIVAVGPASPGAIRVELSPSLGPAQEAVVARLRRLLDLDLDPSPVAAHLARDPRLAPLVARRPGLRVPGAFDGFETTLRTILGQQVSVRGATTLAGRLARSLGAPLAQGGHARLTHLPVTAERVADAGVVTIASVGLPRTRAESVVAIARAVAEGSLPELADEAPPADPEESMRRLMTLPGVGPWTATYVAMRALRWADAFPDGDLALRKAMGGIGATQLRAESERWRPWRAYAAQHLWAGGA
jgi:AraC family transcriptional regulator of adaptative response / DNA-3-methyladenine glycosylase II